MPSWCWCCCSRRALDDFPRNLTETRFSAHFDIFPFVLCFFSSCRLFVWAPFMAKIWFQTFVLWLRKSSAYRRRCQWYWSKCQKYDILFEMEMVSFYGWIWSVYLLYFECLSGSSGRGKTFLLVCRLKNFLLIQFARFNIVALLSPSTRNHHPHVCLSVSAERVCVCKDTCVLMLMLWAFYGGALRNRRVNVVA